MLGVEHLVVMVVHRPLQQASPVRQGYPNAVRVNFGWKKSAPNRGNYVRLLNLDDSEKQGLHLRNIKNSVVLFLILIASLSL